MLYKTGNNMFQGLLDFISKSNKLFIFCAYIKLDALKKLIEDNEEKIKSICVRWDKKDLILSSSDIEIYPYLKERNICLYMNPRLHIKAFIDDYKKVFIGSNNISVRALNYPEIDNYNYEIASIVEPLSMSDKIYFFSILNNSILIDDDIYAQIKNQLEKEIISSDILKSTFSIESLHTKKDFLISSLPLVWSIENFLKFYYNLNLANDMDLDCLAHDLALYNIPLGMDELKLRLLLKQNFFNHPFVRKFLKELEIKKELYFGEIKSWIQNNCADVPIPRKWEITKNIQILYNWITELGENKYYIARPHHSEMLCVRS